MFDKDFISRKIKLIHQNLARLEVLSKYSFDDLVKEEDKWNATERYLEKIIMRALDINQHLISEFAVGTEKISGYEDTFYALVEFGVYDKNFAEQIAPSAGLRNRLVHEYNDTRSDIIYQSLSDALAQYAQYCNFILKFIDGKVQHG